MTTGQRISPEQVAEVFKRTVAWADRVLDFNKEIAGLVQQLLEIQDLAERRRAFKQVETKISLFFGTVQGEFETQLAMLAGFPDRSSDEEK